MGIGNRVWPLGDGLTSANPHYPSWGLETDCLRKIRLRHTHPHYPSWGLETDYTPRLSTVFALSLPLMGIGNTNTLDGPISSMKCAHYPSWGLET